MKNVKLRGKRGKKETKIVRGNREQQAGEKLILGGKKEKWGMVRWLTDCINLEHNLK